MKRIFKFILLGLLLLCLVGAVALWKWASQPVEQSITIEQTEETTPTQPVTIQTSYFTTKVPSGYRLQTNSNKPPRLQMTAIQPTRNGLQLSLTSDLVPPSGITGIGDYILRTQNSDYVLQNADYIPEGSTLFKHKVAPYDLTLFWIERGRYVSISSSSAGASSAALEDLLRSVINEWQWL